MQIEILKKEIDQLQHRYGSPTLSAIYGAGYVQAPDVLLMFMNPTGKNISAQKQWPGLRAPWIGTKNVWKILHALNVLSEDIFQQIIRFSPTDWNPSFAEAVYSDLAKRKLYVTNLAKCTQDDAKHLSDKVFRTYLENTKKEIDIVQPKKIIAFGNQVSSILLDKPITVSSYSGKQKEVLIINNREYDVYPVHYPVGQGQRNLPLALKRLRAVLSKNNKKMRRN